MNCLGGLGFCFTGGAGVGLTVKKIHGKKKRPKTSTMGSSLYIHTSRLVCVNKKGVYSNLWEIHLGFGKKDGSNRSGGTASNKAQGKNQDTLVRKKRKEKQTPVIVAKGPGAGIGKKGRED